MELVDYIKLYGAKTFQQKKINDIDAMILSFISYSNFSGICNNGKKATLKEAVKEVLKKHPLKKKSQSAEDESNRLLNLIKDQPRYQDCILSDYEYVGNHEVQFGALSIEFLPNEYFVSFEGTDSLFIGWEEDFILAYEFPTKTHKLAIHYLNQHFTWKAKNLLVGGHSKGGNLALVASMYANPLVRFRINKVYSGDGPGLLDKQYHSKRFERMKRKYIHFMPENSVVGLCLNHSSDYVVKVNNKSIFSHYIRYWLIDDNKFIKSSLSSLSRELNKELKGWLTRYPEEDRKEFVNNLFAIFKRAEIVSLDDFTAKKRNLLKVIYETKNMSEHARKMSLDFIGIILKSLETTAKNGVRESLHNFLQLDRSKRNLRVKARKKISVDE